MKDIIIDGKTIKRHKGGKAISIISVIVSLAIFFILSYLGYEATLGNEANNMILQILGLESSSAEFIMKIGGYISIFAIVFIFISILIARLDAKDAAIAKDIHVTKDQFPELIEAEKEYAKKLGIKKLPKLFVAKDDKTLSIFGATFDNIDVLRINSNYLISTADEHYYAAKFAVAVHLANIALGYYNPLLFFLVSFSYWVPILSQLRNRVMTYNADKIATHLIGKENAMKAIMISEIDIYLLPYVNVEDYLEKTKEVAKNKDMFWQNMFSDTPIPSFRIDAIRHDTDGKLF